MEQHLLANPYMIYFIAVRALFVQINVMVLLIILCLIYILSLHEGLFHIMWVGVICHDIKLNNIIHKLI